MSALQGVFSIVGAIVGAIAGRLVEPVMLHVGFVFQYKKKQENLEVEIKNLEELIEQIKEKVDEAITRGEEVNEPVSNWLAEVEERVPEFKDENTVNENMQCTVFLCPDYISRYRMSKEAENKIAEVKKFTQSGNFSTVALPKPFAQELQFTSSSTNYVNFKSRELVFNNIMAALQDSNVKMIGVYGTGGVGKTTMVEEIGKLVKNGLFDEVVVAVVSQDANVSNIQGQLADRLNLELKGETEVGKASKLWNRLNNGKKNLIILDDMWQELNLKTIGIPITDGNNCCKVVITSRIRGVLEMMRVDRYVPMQVLLEKEAWALFKTKVGNSVDSPELYDIADAVCKECGSLPVAILAVGAALKDKKIYVWEDVLDQFKDSMLKNIVGIDAKVYASLKLSYDRLESSDAKSCFLLCCFFPEDANISIEVLARYCIARSLLGQNTNTLVRARRRVCTVVDILKDACLLLEGIDENFVKMHDVIRDVALSIAKDDGKEILVKHGDKKWPEKVTCESSSAMSLRFNNTLELPDDLVCPQLHTLTMLLNWNIKPLLNVPDRFFSGMEKLTILESNRICMLPPLSLANLVNLRMLRLDYCELGDVAILKDLNNNLEILGLRGSNIKVLPSEIGQLTRLRLLDLGNCYQLTEIPQGVISNLSRLEELYISDDVTIFNKKRSKVNLDELGKLMQLTTLEIHIPNVMLLPKDFCFENLIRFKISIGMGMSMSMDMGMSMGMSISKTYSKSCKLAGVSLMDKFMVLLLRAEALHLTKIEGLQEVLHDRGGEGSFMERHRLNPSGFFNNLIELTIEDCRLKYLFSLSCARGFPRLQRLQIVDCEMMEAIVGIEEEKDEDELSSQVINFSQLKYLGLENLPKLLSFYPKVENMSTSEGNSSTQAQFLFNEKVAFPVLENLVIRKLPNIIEIWEKRLLIASENESKSCRLKELEVSNCEKLVHVVRFNMLPRLQNLKRFKVDNCPKMEAIVTEKEKEKGTTSNDIIVFSQLTTLNLYELVSLKSFYNWPTRFEAQPLFNHQVAFPILENLVIRKLPNIIEIWENRLLIASENKSKSCRLKELKVSNCEKLVHVVPFNMLPRLQNLKGFTVENCPNIEAIVTEKEKEKEKGTTSNDIIVFSQLTTLNLYELVSLKSFYSWPTRSEAQPLFNHQVAFPILENLVIRKLPNIIEIWENRLLIASENESKSCRLKELKVSNCEKLVHVVPFNMLPRLQNLKGFTVFNCPNIEAIVTEKEKEKEKGTTSNDIIVFSQLTTLNLYELVSLKSFYNWPTRSEAQPLFNHQVSFPKLKTLVLDNCVNSREIHPWNLQAGKISLKFLDVANLDKLIVRYCSEVAEVFQLEGLNVGEGQHIRPLIEVRMMELDGLPQLTCLWNKDPHGILGLQSLQYLTIKKCSLLRNLFTCSTAMALQQLKVLYLESCPVMEEVIAATEDGLKEVIDVIEFPKLEWLILKDLPNLNSFCNANYNFNLPSLQRVVLKRCPNMHNFTFGQVRMSQICVSTHCNDGLQIEDLNKYLKEQLLLKGEECATVDENHYYSDEVQFSDLQWL
ncbi:Disease resistance protein [Camellia lanceoleosa]|uniref:Disease resistance protein n=1 Tax=Camellia lanceoleosa TaxID=1840588 RepID=A0ACC0HGZ6_9ERIC|nr:Disease resistance protein [Camellia lanceoleosa]